MLILISIYSGGTFFYKVAASHGNSQTLWILYNVFCGFLHSICYDNTDICHFVDNFLVQVPWASLPNSTAYRDKFSTYSKILI